MKYKSLFLGLLLALPCAAQDVTLEGNTLTALNVTYKFVRVEAGTFTMGVPSEYEQGDDREKPAHQVTLTKDYYIGTTEVPQALWLAVMKNNPSTKRGLRYPVETVSWDDCQEFIARLNAITGKQFRLPTEAEWEFAASGGNLSQGYLHSGSSECNDVAWNEANSEGSIHKVGTLEPNELGLYDMSGNVWEWCSDWFGPYTDAPQTDPTGADGDEFRVNRGGGYDDDVFYTTVTTRSFLRPYLDCANLGLRLVFTAE